jgi:hypothetical protein
MKTAVSNRKEPRKLIYANNRTVVPPVCSAAKRNPWLAKNTHTTNFLCSIELICSICWLKIVMIIHVSLLYYTLLGHNLSFLKSLKFEI